MGRKEPGVGQDTREVRRQADQIMTVGADAVQQDDELGGLLAADRSERWSRKIARKIEWFVDCPLPPYPMPVRGWVDPMAPARIRANLASGAGPK